ncbi:hypothetical protein MKW98_032759 [Papaver atlanticum]|uniref:Neprosin PEP catalytic domain-containing protein n=1 Tax=Papaver atlanticum TaxID=357466 RepID=A0AAD4X5B0_9MAGN|nr:hypothetical protein MKW98_032759 [Papaver atlanticum]
MAPFFNSEIVHFAALLGSLIVTYHVVIVVEGIVDMKSRLTKQEELSIESQLNTLNKPPIKTMHAPWGDIYDCIEFHKQPAFDHPLLKNHKIEIKQEIVSTNSLKTFMNQLDGCPKGTVPIRRTSREDLIAAKLSVNGPDDQYRAGISYDTKSGETIYGASGEMTVWNPNVYPDQFSSAEIALQSGSQDHINVIKYGWMVNPQLYGNNVTRGFAYWTTDGGKITGCYNTLCYGFIQTHSHYTPDMPFVDTSNIGGEQIYFTAQITLDKQEGKWWLTLQDSIRIGYWPEEFFPAFAPGVASVFWGGRVKSSQYGISPPMGSGQPINDHFADAGFIDKIQYFNMDSYPLQPEKPTDTIDCSEHYKAQYYPDHNALYSGGSGGAECK